MMLIRASDAVNSFGWAIPPQGAPQSHFCDVSAQDTPLMVNDPSAPFIRVVMNQKTTDNDNCWDGANNWYTVPETGLYLINGTFRAPDNAGPFEFGFGIHFEQKDNPSFLWVVRPNNQRWTSPYTRIVKLTQGQQIRMYCYGYPGQYLVNAASIQIGMIARS